MGLTYHGDTKLYCSGCDSSLNSADDEACSLARSGETAICVDCREFDNVNDELTRLSNG